MILVWWLRSPMHFGACQNHNSWFNVNWWFRYGQEERLPYSTTGVHLLSALRLRFPEERRDLWQGSGTCEFRLNYVHQGKRRKGDDAHYFNG
jgi:hypothetical protein